MRIEYIINRIIFKNKILYNFCVLINFLVCVTIIKNIRIEVIATLRGRKTLYAVNAKASLLRIVTTSFKL